MSICCILPQEVKNVNLLGGRPQWGSSSGAPKVYVERISVLVRSVPQPKSLVLMDWLLLQPCASAPGILCAQLRADQQVKTLSAICSAEAQMVFGLGLFKLNFFFAPVGLLCIRVSFITTIRLPSADFSCDPEGKGPCENNAIQYAPILILPKSQHNHRQGAVVPRNLALQSGSGCVWPEHVPLQEPSKNPSQNPSSLRT